MRNYELMYRGLVAQVLAVGELRETRNSTTKSIFGATLTIDTDGEAIFPILQRRKLYHKGVFGELAAMLRGPKTIQDFKDYGCNYWDKFASDNGSISVDYGNAWLDFGGRNQLEDLRQTLLHNPTDRRMVVSGWRPDHLAQLSLPCCHLLYQWYVRDSEFLDMIWYQRSVDVMLGLPSDVMFAYAWNIMIANNVGLRPGRITFVLGDTHISKEHFEKAEEYLRSYTTIKPVHYTLTCKEGKKFENFVPSDITLDDYNPQPPIQMELIA